MKQNPIPLTVTWLQHLLFLGSGMMEELLCSSSSLFADGIFLAAEVPNIWPALKWFCRVKELPVVQLSVQQGSCCLAKVMFWCSIPLNFGSFSSILKSIYTNSLFIERKMKVKNCQLKEAFIFLPMSGRSAVWCFWTVRASQSSVSALFCAIGFSWV